MSDRIKSYIATILIMLSVALIVYIDETCSTKAIKDMLTSDKSINQSNSHEIALVNYSLPTTYVNAIMNMPKIIISEEVEEVTAPEVESTIVEEPVTETPVYIQEIDDGQYPVATYVWHRLKEEGYSDVVCAGIMGNLMAETGGQTLNLNWEAWSDGSYYGIVQWSKKFFPEVIGKDLTGQVDFLLSNIKAEFNTFGYAYQKGFNYDKFLEITDVSEAALAFAKCYERCSSAYYSVRESNAVKAFNFFVGE